jgi:pimeloyl-ACP methyl ester carboxylesterase
MSAARVLLLLALALAAASCGGPHAHATGGAPTVATGAAAPAVQPQLPAGFRSEFADVNGTRLHYAIGGQGSPVVLLHGFAQTGHMWTPLMPRLAQRHTVIVPDLRGAGQSSKPADGYDKQTMAVDIHALTESLGYERVAIVGHDIGLMVAYAYAAQFPQATERVVLMDAFLPGIGNWTEMFLLRDLWHFHFYGETPLALVTGRERTYLEHFWNDFAADRNHSVSEADRRLYAASYAQPGAVQAGMEWFRNFERDAQDFAAMGKSPLTMPVLVIAGEKSGGEFLVDQVRLVANDVQGQVVAGSGHWLMDEAPEVVMAAIVEFLA